MAKLKINDLKLNDKFKSIANYYNGYTFKVTAIDIENNSVSLELRDAGKRYFEDQQKKLDTFIFDINFGCYEKINERPDVNKHDQLEKCGSHAD